MRPKVLYVDDQLGNLAVFRASLRRFVDIQTASSGQEALQLLAVEEFPIIISDQRMDGMSGSELLAQVRQRYPDTIRILLTAHSDFDAVISAINQGQIARFVRKPWDRDEMLSLLEESSRLYWKTKENQALMKQFMQQARLAAVGQMTAGFAHELGNIATKLEIVDLIMQRWEIAPGAHREFDILCGATAGVRSLSRAVLELARGNEALQVQLQPAELGALVGGWMAALRLIPAARKLAKLSFVQPPEPIAVRVDPQKLELAVLNLVKNAAEAAPAGRGEVQLTVRGEGERAVIAVQDNGGGLPAGMESRIGEPGLTTRAQGHGLGLLMTRRLVEAHGGELVYSPAPGGACFSIRVPLLEAGLTKAA